MPFRSIVADPEELTKLAVAFDAAWIGVNRTMPIASSEQSAAREQLGGIIVSLWKQREEGLVEKAIQLFRDQAPPRVSSDKDRN